MKTLSTDTDRFGIPLAGKQEHSAEFLKILKEDDATSIDTAIRTITHSKPLLVFWVSPDGRVHDAENAHHKNPPEGDRSILADPTHKGHLRGRSAFIGNVIYVVIYGDQQYELSTKQLSLLRRSYPRILSTIQNKNVAIQQSAIQSAQFINEIGETLPV